MTAIQCLVCYGIECLKYTMAYSAFWKKRMKRVWIFVLGLGVLYAFIISECIVRNSAKIVLLTFVAMIVSFVSMEGKIKDKILKWLEIVVINLVVDSLCGVTLDWILKNKADNMSDLFYTLCIGISTVAVYTCLWCLGKYKSLRSVFKLRERMITFITFVVVFNGIFAVAVLNYMKIYFHEPSFFQIIDWLTIVAYLSIGIVTILAVELKKKNIKVFKMLMQEKTQREMQEFYYEELLSREEATRRYRHDMSNHMLCIDAMLDRRDFEAVRKYIGDMEYKFFWNLNTCYSTGHRIIDIVTNYQLSRLDSSIKQSVFGNVKQELMVADIDLNVLYSNLLQNAIEDLQKEGEEKFIEIYFEQGNDFCEIKIINSLSNESKRKEDILVSEKKDSRNHGLGLKNVEGVIKKYNGNIRFLKDETIFTVTVYLPNKRTA